MDILQQSLQAADILSGEENDDLFGELGLTFNNPPTETVGLPSELEALATQGDALYNNDNGTSSQSTFEEFDTANDPMELSTFDTSQFLNTAAPVNVATSSQILQQPQQTVPYVSQSNLGRQAVTNSVNSSKQQSYRDNTPLERYNAQLATTVSYNNQYQNGSQARTMGGGAAQGSVPVVLQSASILPGGSSGTVSTIAQSIAVASCSSVFSKAPTQSLTSTVQMKSATQSVTMNQPALPGSIEFSTPIQMVQSSNTGQQQANRQMVTLVQKPTVLQVSSPANQVQANTHVINGIAVQPQAQNHNLAVVKIAGMNRTLNLSDPKIVKALTANILQKQQAEAQNQQVIKLGQNNAVLNMVAQGSQQPTVLRGGQQITLPTGQTIVLNNGQQVQICTSQPQTGQVQVLQPSSVAQTVTAAVRSNQQVASASLSQASRNGQLPFKGIQIASVNIPIVSSSSCTTGGIPSVHGNVVAIPVVGQTGSTTMNAVPAAAITSASTMQMPNSSTVRSLLANAILRQNNISSNSSNSRSSSAAQIQPVSAVNGQSVGTSQTQAPTMLRLNLTPQQLAQLTPVQVQAILKQHQLVQARAAANSNANLNTQSVNTMVQGNSEKTVQTSQTTTVTPILRTPVTTTTVANATKPPNAEQSATQVYKVDPALTEAQIDEVKKLLANRTIASKLHCLTKEQQQLVLAFQAQIKTMSPPVQQYYLRNPQLFMQKVLQQVRAGKPFILQVKVDSQQRPRVVSTVNVQKQQHPTISLTQDPNRANNRVNTPSPVTVQSGPTQQKPQPPLAPIQRSAVPPSVKPTVTVHVPKQAVKRPLPPEHPAKVSLVLEQLDCHKRMVSNPDCIHPFKSVRDAIRRLVPFHTCNIPNVKEEDFIKSERIFDQIADRISTRTRTMMNKYHLLCFRDSTRDSCSAEMVMIERMFLQKEKVKFAEDKARLRENPSLIKEYFPRRASKEENSLHSDDGDMSRQEAETTSVLSAYDQSVESPLSNDDASAVSRISEGSSDFRTEERGRFSSLDSSTGANNAKRLKHSSADNSFENQPPDMLLQEAVDSILI